MPGSQCCKYVSSEFQLKKFGCCDVHPARFIYFQWRVPLCVVLGYRIILAVYTIVWLIYSTRGGEIQIGGTTVPVVVFLTTWTYFVLTLYLVLHCLLCILYARKRGGICWERMAAENHRQLFHELQVQPSLWGRNGYEEIPTSDLVDGVDTDTEAHTTRLHWLPKLIWFLYNIASNASLMVTLVFWILLYPHLHISDGDKLSVNVQLHAINSLIVVIELCLSAVPIYLPHYVYTLLYGIIYLVFSGIYYAIDHSHILYPDILDWSKPGRTTAVCVVTAFVVLPIIQLILFVIYKVRLWIYDRCNPELI